MRRLIPASGSGRLARGGDALELAEAYAYPTMGGGGSWLRASMVASVDGAAHHGRRSEPLSGPADKRVFGVLRALADVVVVGAETVRLEGYGPVRRRAEFAEWRAAAGQAPAAAIAVVSASLSLDFDQPLFTEPTVPTLVLTGAKAPPARVAAARAAGAEVVVAGEGSGVDAELVKPQLVARGHTRLLCEGGPRLLGQLAVADVLDELCLTTGPRLAVGTADRVTTGPELAVPRQLELTDLLTESGFLFARYRRA